MPDPSPDRNRRSDFTAEPFPNGKYSVWDLGPRCSDGPATAARLDAMEKELVALSEQIAKLRIADMLGAHHPDLHGQVIAGEMEHHEKRVSLVKLVLQQIRTGVDF